jgi:hypothetical protein
MRRGREKPMLSVSNDCSTTFLDQLATQLKIGRDSAYRRAVQRTLPTVKKNYESGVYHSTTEAELMLRKLVDKEANPIPPVA